MLWHQLYKPCQWSADGTRGPLSVLGSQFELVGGSQFGGTSRSIETAFTCLGIPCDFVDIRIRRILPQLAFPHIRFPLLRNQYQLQRPANTGVDVRIEWTFKERASPGNRMTDKRGRDVSLEK